jgi:O-antigen/teichoic acid export membrane protein
LVVPLLPILSSVTIDPARRQELTLSIIRIAIFVGVAGAIAMSAGAPLLVGLIYGAEFEDAVWPLRILGVAYIGVVLGYVGTTAVFALGKTWSQIPRVALIAVVSIGLQIPVIDAYGATGAAAVTALTEAAIALNGLWLVRKHLGVRLRALRLPVAMLVAAVGVVVPALTSNIWIALAAGAGLILALVPLGLVRREDLAMALRRS